MPLNLHMTHSLLGYIVLFVFISAYFFVVIEEITQLRKSKPIMLSAGIIWLLVAIAAKSKGLSLVATKAISHNLLEFGQLFLFLLVAMTYINVLSERKVFDALKEWLIEKQLSYRSLFWLTGILAFFISPIADNMTTALIFCAIILAVDSQNRQFVTLSCINIVVAANAGGAFSPFGDVTTLMVWQAGTLPFGAFFHLFLPCLINFLVPAFFMSIAIPRGFPSAIKEKVNISQGGMGVLFLFLFTIFITVCFQHFYALPPAFGMMTGLALLQFFGYYLKKKTHNFDIFYFIQRIEWDTFLFFYGVMLCIGGLAALGYLDVVSNTLYEQWGAHLSKVHQQTPANIMLGLLSAIIDNIPLMFAVLTMDPAMSKGQWLLVTLTTGVGGSLLSIGSAAGVALMGQARGNYTFFAHCKWTWAIALGYIAAIISHFIINNAFFNI